MGLIPNLSIVDGLTQRKQTEEVDVSGAEKKKFVNPAGEIRKKTWDEIRNHFQDKEKRRRQIIIEGEEDLLALAVIVESPIGSYVIYGVPPIEKKVFN